MPIFVLVEKVVLLVCIKSALIMSFPARTIYKSPFKTLINILIYDSLCLPLLLLLSVIDVVKVGVYSKGKYVTSSSDF